MVPGDEAFSADLYSELPPKDKREFEKRVLNDPYKLTIDEMRTLFEAGFPFSRLDCLWIEKYLELVNYQRLHGECECVKLSNWLTVQRNRRKHGILLLGRETALNRLGFVWDLRDTILDRNIKDLEAYHKIHGHLVGVNDRLLQFIRRVRRMQKNNDSLLSPVSKARLNAIQFPWTSRRPHRLTGPYACLWDQRYDEARDFLESNPGRIQLSKWPDTTLSKWVTNQYLIWDKLLPQRRQKLRRLGLIPYESVKSAWETRYQRALDTHKQLGSYHYATYFNANKTVNRWIMGQLQRWSRLSPDQKRKVIRLGVQVEKPDIWETCFQKALDYATLGNRYSTIDGRTQIRIWIRRQFNRKEPLDADRLHRLRKLLDQLDPDLFPTSETRASNE